MDTVRVQINQVRPSDRLRHVVRSCALENERAGGVDHGDRLARLDNETDGGPILVLDRHVNEGRQANRFDARFA